ncbi:MAG: hypothetical protein J2P28_18505 [Actinobacteria bacterium]|nr:hypothetical protein [Actinomycetota bacterium]MBO0886495.1 hypothetical protein [Acidimicrobiales bacterium]
MIEAGPDITARALEVIDRTEAHGVEARLLGGAGVAALLGERCPPACRRVPGDIDLAAPSARRKQLGELLESAGLVPDRHFNALHGRERLAFAAPDGLKVDVILDVLRMCHVVQLAVGLRGPAPCLPAWLLLVTKLQIVELTEKDRNDVAAMLVACSPEELDFPAVARLCAEDWGLWRSLTGSLAEVVRQPPELVPAQRERLAENAAALAQALESQPKSRRWRMRARLGERVRWYELPESP